MERMLAKPTLDVLFQDTETDKALRNERIQTAVHEHDYTLFQLQEHLRMYYSTISRIVTRVDAGKMSKNKTSYLGQEMEWVVLTPRMTPRTALSQQSPSFVAEFKDILGPRLGDLSSGSDVAPLAPTAKLRTADVRPCCSVPFVALRIPLIREGT